MCTARDLVCTKTWNRVWNLHGRRGAEGELINQGPCIHICLAHGHRQRGGKGLGGGQGGLEEVNGGEKETYVILPTIKNYKKT